MTSKYGTAFRQSGAAETGAKNFRFYSLLGSGIGQLGERESQNSNCTGNSRYSPWSIRPLYSVAIFSLVAWCQRQPSFCAGNRDLGLHHRRCCIRSLVPLVSANPFQSQALDYASLHTVFWMVAIVVLRVCQHDVFRLLTDSHLLRSFPEFLYSSLFLSSENWGQSLDQNFPPLRPFLPIRFWLNS